MQRRLNCAQIAPKSLPVQAPFFGNLIPTDDNLLRSATRQERGRERPDRRRLGLTPRRFRGTIPTIEISALRGSDVFR